LNTVLLENNTNLHQRNNIIKLQSLIYNLWYIIIISSITTYLNICDLKVDIKMKAQKNLKVKFSFEGISTVHDIVAIILL